MSTGIDAAVVLGLAGKASQVFADPGTYLSFPLGPIGIERSRLQALVSDPLSPDGQSGLLEFSSLVNEVPDGPVWQPDGDRLWDIYGDVLAGAELADATRTPEEEADYQRAYALLYRNQPDGSAIDSPAVVAFEQHRDAYLAAAQEYNNRKGQASLTTDQVVRAQWTADEPVLRERMTEAQQHWATAGHRAEVENARRLLQEFGSRSPLMVWAGYRKLFDPDMPEIYFRTATDGSMYLETAYFPTDVVDAAWPTITVTKGELAALAAAAPEGLRSRLSGGSDPAAVEKVSFEYSSIAVHRPWFAPEVFASRAWRFYEAGRVLSDGGTPPSGQCTAYVSGLVLARNIKLTRPASGRPSINLGFLPTAKAAGRVAITRPQPSNIVINRAKDRARTVAVARDRAAASRITRMQPQGSSSTMRARTPAVARPAAASAGREMRVASPPARVMPRNLSAARIPGIRRLFLRPPGRPSPTEAEVTPADSNYVYVLAFVCRLLPKAPNPDPQLEW